MSRYKYVILRMDKELSISIEVVSDSFSGLLTRDS
jgi:hypothetical protein